MTGTLRLAAKLPRPEAWINDAPCAAGSPYDHDLPPIAPSPALRRYLMLDFQVTAALARCRSCPFTQQCLDRVQPTRNYYDGVCGGLVFLNGTAIGGLVEQGGAA